MQVWTLLLRGGKGVTEGGVPVPVLPLFPVSGHEGLRPEEWGEALTLPINNAAAFPGVPGRVPRR